MSENNPRERAINSIKNRIPALQEQRGVASRAVDMVEEAIKSLSRTDDFGNAMPADIGTALRKVRACLIPMKQFSDFFNDEPRFLIQVHNKLVSSADEPELQTQPQEPEPEQERGNTDELGENKGRDSEEATVEDHQTEPAEEVDPAAPSANPTGSRRPRRKRQSSSGTDKRK